jgi:hypothetical protein
VSTNEVEVKGYQITSCRKKGALMKFYDVAWAQSVYGKALTHDFFRFVSGPHDRCRFPVPARRSTTRYAVMVWHLWQFQITQLPSSQVFSLGTGDQRNQRSPPLASRCSPVSQWESSDARKTATGAISVTCPIRPNGVWATRAFSKSEPINPPV